MVRLLFFILLRKTSYNHVSGSWLLLAGGIDVQKEVIRLKLLKIRRLLFAKIRKRHLINRDFTIISNNCWGGMLYESYDLPKMSPTVGLFFLPDDYIKFCSDLRGYLSKELIFIAPEKSKHIDYFRNRNKYGTYPVGVLGDIEIYFLHYHSEAEAKEKWDRRCKRINWNHLIVKFNDQNGCTAEQVKTFAQLPFKNKLFFTVKEWGISFNGLYKINQPDGSNGITASYEPFGRNKYIDLISLINSL